MSKAEVTTFFSYVFLRCVVRWGLSSVLCTVHVISPGPFETRLTVYVWSSFGLCSFNLRVCYIRITLVVMSLAVHIVQMPPCYMITD